MDVGDLNPTLIASYNEAIAKTLLEGPVTGLLALKSGWTSPWMWWILQKHMKEKDSVVYAIVAVPQFSAVGGIRVTPVYFVMLRLLRLWQPSFSKKPLLLPLVVLGIHCLW